MSKYTTEVRFICEESAGLVHSEGYSSIDSVLDKARDKVFDFYFPIFDENYRTTLENKILKHYYTREIGFETVGLWKHFLDVRMNEIMPYYNQLYTSELIKFNPMYDVDLTTDYNKINNGNSDKSSTFTEHGSFEENDSKTQHENSASVTTTTENSNAIEETNTNATELSTQNKIGNEISSNNEAGTASEKALKVESANHESSSTRQEQGEMQELTSGESTKNAVTNETANSNGTDNTSSTSHGTDNNTITNKNDHWEYFSDTPEGGIDGLDPTASSLGQNNYLTTATHITDDGTGSSHNKTIDNNSDSEKILTNNSEATKNANETGNDNRATNRTTEINTTSSDNGTNNNESETSLNKEDNKSSNGVIDTNENVDGSIEKTGNSATSTSGDKTGNKTTNIDADINANGVKIGNDEKTGNSNSNEVIKNIEDYLHHVVGKSGGISYSKLLNEYRDTFLNIDMLIIKDLRDLFMNVW